MILSGTTSQTAASFPDRKSLAASFGQIPSGQTIACAEISDMAERIDAWARAPVPHPLR